ncbi:Putative Holliday junction resolvase [Luteitalea pratensis]|uniref:Putative pre-16S rRNA nuclease n=1 Tax=Luteitalea pratensis TaxID=1855912 RepID=A0A143PNF9_LUTPR|nr:Putative Holliday junction resolvase [Luteitalea pratensis]
MSVRVLAFDLGARRTGVAISDASGTLARPLEVVQGPSLKAQWAALLGVISRVQAEDPALAAIVVGVPHRLDGTATDFTPKALDFIERLSRRVPVPVVPLDERLTSVEAEALLAEHESDWRRRKARLDAAAAAVLLQEYLDSRTRAPLA